MKWDPTGMEWIVGSRIRYGRPPPLAFRRETSSPFGRRHVFTSFTLPPILVYPNIFSKLLVGVLNFNTKNSRQILLHSCHFALPSFPLRLSSSFSQSRTRQGFAPCTAVLHCLGFSTLTSQGPFPAFHSFFARLPHAFALCPRHCARLGRRRLLGVHEHCRVIPHGVGRI